MKNVIELCDITVKSSHHDEEDLRPLISKLIKKTYN